MADSMLLKVLRDPACLKQADAHDWERLIFEAGDCGLTPRVAAQIDAAGLSDLVPERAGYHFELACLFTARQHEAVAMELKALTEALAEHDLPFVLLKGGAYVVGGFAASQGRTLSDIDILVRKEDLAIVEGRLEAAGWIYVKRDPYDQEYYRRWMHELPPMTHIDRHSALDVHHTVTPPTSAMAVEGARIFERAVFGGPTGHPLIGLPMPADLVLHSAVHLFNDSEFDAGLRDVSDLDLLFRSFGQQEDFWPSLLARAKALGLGSSLTYAVSLCRAYFATPIPADTLAGVMAQAPNRLVRGTLSALFTAALNPPDPAGEPWTREPALFALYVRGHALRMPPRLLLPHLLKQARRRARGEEEREPAPA